MNTYGIYFGFIATLSILVGGGMYLAYGFLPHVYYLPASLLLTVVSGILVYFIMARVVEL